jgi:hypothetical protein
MWPTALLHCHVALRNLGHFDLAFLRRGEDPSSIEILASHYNVLLGVVRMLRAVECVNDLSRRKSELAMRHDIVPCFHKEVSFVESMHKRELFIDLFDESDLLDDFVEERPFVRRREDVIYLGEREAACGFS